MTLTWDHKSLVNGEVPPVKIVHVLNPHPYPHCIIFAVGPEGLCNFAAIDNIEGSKPPSN